ncbi:MAG TPA: hypothetical protein VGL63_05155 [Streptosporangiaceae bacterium]
MDRRTLSLHQVRPAILGTDIAAAAASWVLLWKRKRAAGILVRLGPPAIAASLVANSQGAAEGSAPPGSAIKPSPAVGIRLAGDVLAAWGSWRHSRPMVLAGVTVIALGWTFESARAEADPPS